MENIEDRDTYVAQLREVFISCDTTGSGCLDESELNALCRKLQLADHSSFLIYNLLKKKHLEEVKFDDFKNCFIALLTQSVPNEEESLEKDEVLMNVENSEREVSPKFTLGEKKYGRRSRPASIVEEDESLSPLNSRSNSDEQSSPPSSMNCKNSTKSDVGSAKRPMSPSYPQHPTIKSGRMNSSHSDLNSLDQEKQEVYSHQRNASDSDGSSSFENNPVEYLRQTWKKLGIGKQGYLTVDELALVCEHIGMDMTEEVVGQLFEKLDCDQDGRISFDEFLQGLFQHGELQGSEPLSSPKTGSSSSSSSLFKDSSREDQVSTSWVSGIFSSIDTACIGYASSTSILELWESLEVPCSPQILKELGFNLNDKINLSDLTTFLEEELINSLNTPLGQLAFVSYQNELNYLRQVNEQICIERNKLKENIEEANARAALLAQEVDDNHMRLENALKEKLLLAEKKYHEQVRELAEELKQERDTITAQTNKLIQKLQTELESIREEEAHLKSRLTELEQENCRLESELHEMTEKYLESKKQKELLEKELLIIPELKARLEDMESRHGAMQEQQHESLMIDNENYKKMNQELQDRIDELTLEIENLRQQNSVVDNVSNHGVSRTHSWLSDYKKASSLGFKRRGSDSSSDENSDDESPTIGKIRRKFLSPDGQDLDTCAGDDKSMSDGFEEGKVRNCDKPSKIDILLKEMFVDRERLMIKLQNAEEQKQRAELSNIQLRNKCRILTRLAYDAAKAVVA